MFAFMKRRGRWIGLVSVISLSAAVATVYSFPEHVGPFLGAAGDSSAEHWPLELTQAGPRDFRPFQVVPAFPALTTFPVKTVREAAKDLNPTELVLAVTVGKEARAYPINMLTGPQREILNDTLDGKLIAATW